jgi:hypothetical protein
LLESRLLRHGVGQICNDQLTCLALSHLARRPQAQDPAPRRRRTGRQQLVRRPWRRPLCRRPHRRSRRLRRLPVPAATAGRAERLSFCFL